jgi:hypothetical protein
MRRNLALVILAILPTAGCLVRKRTVPPPPQSHNLPPRTASKEELIQLVRRASEAIQSFSMRADISPSVVGQNGGELTDYATIRGYFLFHKPDEIRINGLDPVVHSAMIFDMASAGTGFRVYIPSKNRFLEGSNDAPAKEPGKLENLRPAAFLDALLIAPVDAADLTMIEDDSDNSQSQYILLAARMDAGQLRLVRAVYFNRFNLEIQRQRAFNAAGAIVSESHYSGWKDFGGIWFPSSITIRRPLDGYEVGLSVVDLKFNLPDVTPDRFVLEPPQGTRIETLK